MARYLLLNYFAGARGNMCSALVCLTAQGWRNVDSMAGNLGSHTGSGYQKRRSSFWQSHTNYETERSEEARSERRASEEARMAPRYSLSKPWAKGGVMTGKQHVARIVFLYWATVALARPCQAPGPETVLVAHTLELLTQHRACSLSRHPSPERAPSGV